MTLNRLKHNGNVLNEIVKMTGKNGNVIKIRYPYIKD